MLMKDASVSCNVPITKKNSCFLLLMKQYDTSLPLNLIMHVWLSSCAANCGFYLQRTHVSNRNERSEWPDKLITGNSTITYCIIIQTMQEELKIKQCYMEIHERNSKQKIIFTWEVGAEGSRVQDQPLLHIKFEASLGYITRSCPKIFYSTHINLCPYQNPT